jgi:hypothetical protein
MPTPEIPDQQFLNMELALPRDGDGPELARVKKRLRDEDGNPVGRANDNLFLDTTWMIIRRPCQQTQYRNACLPRSIMKAIDYN